MKIRLLKPIPGMEGDICETHGTTLNFSGGSYQVPWLIQNGWAEEIKTSWRDGLKNILETHVNGETTRSQLLTDILMFADTYMLEGIRADIVAEMMKIEDENFQKCVASGNLYNNLVKNFLTTYEKMHERKL